MISDYDREHMADILAGEGDWFTARLLRLIAKADFENMAKLRLGFPDEVQAYLDWMATQERERTEIYVPKQVEDTDMSSGFF